MGIDQSMRIRDAVVRIAASVALVVGYLLVGAFVSEALSLVGVDDSIVAACVMDALVAIVLAVALAGEPRPRARLDVRDGVMVACGMFVVWLVGIMCATSLQCSLKDTAWVEYTTSFSGGSAGATMALSLLFAPVAEELMMRRILYAYLRQIGVVFGMVVTSVLFAGMHGTLVHLPFTFLLGLFLCVVLDLAGRVWVCMACHSGANALSLFLAPNIHVPDAALHPAVCATLFVATVCCLFWVSWSVHRREVGHVES